jgi:transposase
MENLSDFIPVKRISKCALSINEKTIILNVFNSLQHQKIENSVDGVVEVCSKMTGIGKSTIYRLIREKKSGAIKPPKQSTGRHKISIDEAERHAIRRKVHAFYFNNEIPTLDKILCTLREDETISDIRRDALWKILREMNFRWEKVNRKSLLIEKDEIICWRRNYLRSIRDFRKENRKIYYLDETWLNEGYTVGKMWHDKNITSSRQAYLNGLSVGIKPPSGKGKRLIITHIGSRDGFLKEGLLAFESVRTGDYHEDMNADVFEDYFSQMINFIPPGSVIVLDNAPYHSRRDEQLPTTAWKKAQIIEWLLDKEITFKEDMLKKELLSITNMHRHRFLKYAIDEMAKKREIIILRLPPYHCELNPIELIWAQVKGSVARKNTTYKMEDVRAHFEEALKEVNAERWRKCIEHVMKEEQKMWELDNVIEQTMEPLIINLGPDESSSDCSFSDS